MYCPSCAKPIENNQKFCRACGANVSLIPQALTGQLPINPNEDEELTRQGKRKLRKSPTIENAAGKFFTGIGFLIAALFVTFRFPGGFVWGWSLLIPGFALIGEGIGQYLKVEELRRERERLSAFPVPALHVPQSFPPQPHIAELSAPTTSELATPPASISEHTTKNLNRQ